MYLCNARGAGLALALLSTLCWGSWSNAIVFSKGRVRLELFYLDYTVATVLTSILGGITIGSVKFGDGVQERTFFHDFTATARFMLLALGAGIVFGVANLLLTLGVRMSGLAIAFPLNCGTALVLGTLLTYLVDKSGVDAVLLFLGVLLAFAAVCLTSLVHRLQDRAAPLAQQDGGGSAAQEGPSTLRKLAVCLVGGVLMSCWSPLATAAQKNFDEEEGSSGTGLSPYGEFFFFTIGSFLSTAVFIPLTLLFPLDGTKGVTLLPVLAEYRHLGLAAHTYGWLGGGLWSIGTLANPLAGACTNFAVSYAIGQAAPLISILWGVFYFKQFAGSGPLVWGLLVLICILYSAAIACIARSHS